MKKHIKVYFNTFGIDKGDFIPCENCGMEAVDIHHIEPRRMGGSKLKDVPDNLMALCRLCHERAELIRRPYLRPGELKAKHEQYMEECGVE